MATSSPAVVSTQYGAPIGEYRGGIGGAIGSGIIDAIALIIKRADKRLNWVATPVAKTSNLYVLLTLVDRIQHGAL